MHALRNHLCASVILFVACFAACSGESRDQRTAQPKPEHTEQANSEHATSVQGESTAAAPPALGELLGELHPIERKVGDFTVLDRLSNAHNFGGWRTNSRIVVYCAGEKTNAQTPCASEDLQTAWLSDGASAATLFLPPAARGQTLTLFLEGHATLYIDGTEAAQVQKVNSAPVSVQVPEGDGFAKLTVRANKRSSVSLGDAGKQAGAAVHWLAYGPKEAPQELTQSASPTRFVLPLHLTEAQAPGQVRVTSSSTKESVSTLTWVGAQGTRKKLGATAQYATQTDGQMQHHALFELDKTMRDGVLEIDSTKLGQAPKVTLHAASPARSSNTDAQTIEPSENVIVFLVDTLRADKLRIYERNSRVQTPALDAWTKGATRFTAAHTQENWTKPSVATLMSSTLPWQHMATTGDAVLPKRIATMSELLQKEGFYTGFFSANGYVSDKFGFGRGWNTYRNYIREGRKNPAQYVAQDVLEWLDKRPKDKRFFLYVHTIDPHVPYRPPSEFSEMYDPEPYNGVVNFRKDATLLENIKMGRIKLRERDKAQLVALYDGEITYHDVWFGKILEGLKARGLDQNTAMVFTSDHGEEFWDHGSVGHGHNVFEELLHIPMVMRIPGIRSHRAAIDTPMGLVDVAPTMFDALGIATPDSFEGSSQLKKMAGQAPASQSVAVSGFMDNWRTIVTGDWKLIMKGNLDPRLYHLPTDPSEQTNLINEQPMVGWHLMQRLGQELGRTAPKPRSSGGGTAKVEKTTIDAQTRAQLRALGYIE